VYILVSWPIDRLMGTAITQNEYIIPMNLPNTRLTGPAPRVAKASNPNTEKSLSADSVRPNTELKILSIIKYKGG